MKQCPECSAQNSADSKFCKSCGANIESIANSSKDLSAAASGILNQAGNFLIMGAKKIEQPPRKETSSSEAEAEENVFFKLIHSKHRKWLVLAAASITVVFIIILSLNVLNSKKLIGMWKMYPNEAAGYGICLEISKDAIEATGDYVNFGGRMTFKYKIVDDSSLVLQYDWIFDQWPWSFPHVSEIPLKYSLNEDGTMLTLTWDGTSFVFLDNTYNMDYFNQNGAIMNSGSVTFTKVK